MGGCTSRKQVARSFATPRPPNTASARCQPPSSSGAPVIAGKSVGRRSSSSGGQESSKTAEAEPESEVGQKGQPRPLPPPTPPPPLKEVVPQQQRVVMPPPPPQTENPAVGVATTAPARAGALAPPAKQQEKTSLERAAATTPPVVVDEDMRFDLESLPKQPDNVHEGSTSIAPRRTPPPPTAPAAAAATRLRSGTTPPSVGGARSPNTPTEKTMKVFAAATMSGTPGTLPPKTGQQSPLSTSAASSAKLFGKPMMANPTIRAPKAVSADVATPAKPVKEARKEKQTVQRSKTPPSERPKTATQRTRPNPSRTPVIEPTQADDDDEPEKVEIFDLVIPGTEPPSTKASQKSRSMRHHRIGLSDCVQLLSPPVKAATPQALPPGYDDFSPLPVIQFESEDENVVEQNRKRSPAVTPTARGANATGGGGGHGKCGCKCKPEEHTLYDVSEEIRDLHFDLISDNSL